MLQKPLALLATAYVLACALTLPSNNVGNVALLDVNRIHQSDMLGIELEVRKQETPRPNKVTAKPGHTTTPTPTTNPKTPTTRTPSSTPTTNPKTQTTQTPSSTPTKTPLSSSSTLSETSASDACSVSDRRRANCENGFPILKNPYNNKEFDLCGYYIDCPDDEEDHDTLGEDNDAPERTRVRRGTLAKRNSRTVGEWTALPYPASSQLYKNKARKHSTHHVFRSKSKELSDWTVTDNQDKDTDEAWSIYATEHIIELQTWIMFKDYVVANDKKLRDHFTRQNLETEIRSKMLKRKPKPDYAAQQELQTRPKRENYAHLIFEAFGTTVNWKNFVLLKHDINSVKEHIWAQKDPISLKKHIFAWKSAMRGDLPSNEYLSSLKTVFGVYSYMNNKHIVECTNNINNNIRTELEHASELVSGFDQGTDLKKHWDTFMDELFEKIDTSTQEWLKEAVLKPLEAIPTRQKELEKLFEDLKELERKNNPNRDDYMKKKKKEHEEKEKIMEDAKNAWDRVEKELQDLKKKDKNKMTKAERNKHKDATKEKNEEVLRARTKFYTAQTALHSLYASSVKDMIDNLDKDKTILEDYKKEMDNVKLEKLKPT